ncbi:MAG: alpha/beta fold hydrolase [Candidatus Binatia bacterium]
MSPDAMPLEADGVPRPRMYYTEPRRIRVRGLQTAYRRKGPGSPAVLFLHGAGLTRMWLPFYERMSQHVDFIAPEHPGFGETPLPEWLRGFDDVVLHYDDLLDELGVERIHLVGYSLGGWMAAEFACFYPRRLKSLTLITPIGLRIDDPGADLFQMPRADLWERLFNDKSALAAVAPDPGDVEEAIHLYGESTALAKLIWAPRYNLALERRLQRLPCKALVVRASDDRLIPNRMAERYAEVLPNCSLVEIPDTGHALVVERPEAVADAILQHIEGAGR